MIRTYTLPFGAAQVTATVDLGLQGWTPEITKLELNGADITDLLPYLKGVKKRMYAALDIEVIRNRAEQEASDRAAERK